MKIENNFEEKVKVSWNCVVVNGGDLEVSMGNLSLNVQPADGDYQ